MAFEIGTLIEREYDKKYGEDLVAFARGDPKLNNINGFKINTLTFRLFPWVGVCLKYHLEQNDINRWLGIVGTEPVNHFIECNNEALLYTRLWIENAYLNKEINYRKYRSYMHVLFNINIEPSIQSQLNQDSDDNKRLGFFDEKTIDMCKPVDE